MHQGHAETWPLPPPPRPDDRVEVDHLDEDHLEVDPAGPPPSGPRHAVPAPVAPSVTEPAPLPAIVEDAAPGRVVPAGPVSGAGGTPTDATAIVREIRRALERADTPRERFAAARQLAGEPLACDDVVAVLDAVPAGWQRRTVLRRLVRGGALDDVDAGRLVQRFAGDAERARVATLLVDAGLAHVAAVTDHLGPAAADRLRRRLG